MKFVQRAYEESLVAFFESTARQIDILGAYAGSYLVDAYTELRKFLLVDTDFNFILETTADFHGGCTFLGLEICLDAIFGQAPQRLQSGVGAFLGTGLVFLVEQTQSHDRLRRRIESQQQWAAGFQWQRQDVEFLADINTGNVHVGTPEKFQRNVGLPGPRNGSYEPNIANNADGFLHRLGQEVFDFDRRGPGQFGANRNGGIGDIG